MSTNNKITEYSKMYGKYHLLVLFVSWGYRLGYIGIPEKEYEKIVADTNLDFAIHGGITYNETIYGKIDTPDRKDSLIYIGFDCYHYSDVLDKEAASKYFGDTIVKTLDIIDTSCLNIKATTKDLNFVLGELQNLLKQIRDTPDMLVYKYCKDTEGLGEDFYYKWLNGEIPEEVAPDSFCLYLKLNNIEY